MTSTSAQPIPAQGNAWLKPYYFSRAAFSAVWVLTAFTVGQSMPGVAAALLLVYPAWDAAANFVDARRHGGLQRNFPQSLNMIASAVTAVAVAIALGISMNAVLGVFGVWAVLSGLFQLATGVRRWKYAGAQWAMILSGAQSALAGAFFVKQAYAAAVPSITVVAPYAAFGAFYFLLSALWLTVSDMRRRKAAAVQT
ncbi:Short repeat of unknown function [Polaromonas sp. YR568]|uniref:DUF308 domain-containing protein n=1 Tax=Polaromonas sp. YR568 TaxID=1855301 RepID=UPI0008F0EAA4|nr:DUF308 domain-containing protein [Polaromonas sp. YR568]SFU85345.1 Short repeat of unknown function [Polaromonas sp. YR568]